MPKPVIHAIDPDSLAREGLTDRVEIWEDGLRANTGRGSFEWWYFDAHFDDGSTAVIVFMTKPILERKGPLKPGVSMTITRPDGVKLVRFPLFSPESFLASKEGCDVRIEKNRVRGDLHRYELHAESDGMVADLVFTGSVPPWRPGAGKVGFGDLDHYFAWLPAIPYGMVEGSLTYDGKTISVSGTGYHDHNWGNIGLNNGMDHWYWGRAHLGEYTLIFVEQITARAYGLERIPVFMLAKGDQILTGDGAPLRLEKSDFVKHEGGREYPRQLDFYWDLDDKHIHLKLRQPDLIEATSLLTLFSRWKQKMMRLVANPYYFRFNADLELSIDFGEIQANERGPALYELMILR